MLRKNRSLWLLWIAMLISSTGSFLFLTVLAARLFETTGSGLIASAVFASQWLLPFIAGRLVARVACGRHPQKAIVKVEIGGALVSFAAGVMFDYSLLSLFGILLIRGWLDATSRSLRTVIYKTCVRNTKHGSATALFNTSTYIGGAIGGALGFLISEHLTIYEISAINAVCFILSATTYSLIKDAPSLTGRNVSITPIFKTTWDILHNHPRLMSSYLSLLLVVAVLEGFHNVARTILPLQIWDLGEKGVTILQTFSSAAIVIGAILISIYSRLQTYSDVKIWRLTVLLSVIFLIFSTFILDQNISLTTYFFFMLFYEAAYTQFFHNIIIYCPEDKIGVISSSFNIALPAGLFIVTLISAFASEWLSIWQLAILHIGIMMIGAIFIRKKLNRVECKFRIPPHCDTDSHSITDVQAK